MCEIILELINVNLIYFIFGVIFISKSFRIIVKYKPNIIWYWNCTIIYIICFSVKPIKFIIVSVSQFIQLFSVLSDTRFIQCSLWSVRSETCVINLLHRVVGPYSPKQPLSTSQLLPDSGKTYKASIYFVLYTIVNLIACISSADIEKNTIWDENSIWKWI